MRNIGVDPDDEAIVRATIAMAHNLNRGVVAEGVEIEQHLEFLRAQGCEVLQGYLFCRPAAGGELREPAAGTRRSLLGVVAVPSAGACLSRRPGAPSIWLSWRGCANSNPPAAPARSCPSVSATRE